MIDDTERYYCFNCHMMGSSLIELYVQLYGIDDLGDTDEQGDIDTCGGAAYIISKFLADDGKPDIEAVLRDLVGDYSIEGASSDRPEVVEANLRAAQDYARGNFYDDPLAFTNWRDPHTSGMFAMMMRGFLPDTMEFGRVADWQRWPDHPVFLPLMFNDEVYGYQLKGIYEESNPRFITMSGFHKNDHVIGWAPRGARYGMVVEGKTDQLMSYQYGWRPEDGYASFAILGSHLSEIQARLIAQHCDIVISAVDADDAGNAAHEWIEYQMRPYQMEIRRLPLRCKDIGLTPRKMFYEAVRKVGIEQFGKPIFYSMAKR